MKALLLVPDQDSPGRKDVTHAFLPEARAFARHHKLDADDPNTLKRFPTNAPLDHRRAVCSLALRSVSSPIDVLALFCHGWKAGVQCGWMRQHVQTLARLLGQHMRIDGHVLLYACDTAKDMDDDEVDERAGGPGGDGGFADMLRDSCEVLGRRVQVMGHTQTAHTTMNPFARYFAPGCGGKGGHWYVEPDAPHWSAWCRALRDPRSTLRYRFWQMTPDEIAAELARKPPPPLVG